MEGNETFRHLHIFQDSGTIDEWYVKDFEKHYNICLPKTYKELILKHNGCSFDESYFDFINKSDEKDMRCFGFFDFGEPAKGKELITEENKHLQDPLYYGVKNLIGFASTAEGDTVCFDYRDNPKTCEPKIVVLVHDEYETDPDGYEHMKVESVAESFDAFLDMLYEFQDDEES